MNTRILIRGILVFTIILVISSCKKKEESSEVINPPVVTTSQASDITSTSATVGGNIISTGRSSILQKGVCYKTQSNPTINDSCVKSDNPDKEFECTITGLTQNTIYFVRAYAMNSAGISYGEEMTFTTQRRVKPVVVTSFISDITQSTAVSGGNVTDDGGQPVTARGICWSTSHLPTIDDHHTSDGTGAGEFVSQLADLSLKTSYFIRAYAITVAGISYGNEQSLMTQDTSCGHPCPGVLVVEYEGKTYHTVLIGPKCWLSENLNVGVRIDGSATMDPSNGQIEKYCYNDNEESCEQFGALYQWDEIVQNDSAGPARGICPPGWHIPTLTDFTQVIVLSGGNLLAGIPMKYNTTWDYGGNGSNLSGFAALAAGLRYLDGTYSKQGTFSFFWARNSQTETGAWYCALNNVNTKVITNIDNKVLGFSARCVKD